ncbi:MAG: hypothetical protein Q4G63_12405 [Bacteroidia bacterium]|nr:hypothetical protein [Bacteroidia bacterium]
MKIIVFITGSLQEKLYELGYVDIIPLEFSINWEHNVIPNTGEEFHWFSFISSNDEIFNKVGRDYNTYRKIEDISLQTVVILKQWGVRNPTNDEKYTYCKLYLSFAKDIVYPIKKNKNKYRNDTLEKYKQISMDNVETALNLEKGSQSIINRFIKVAPYVYGKHIPTVYDLFEAINKYGLNRLKTARNVGNKTFNLIKDIYELIRKELENDDK